MAQSGIPIIDINSADEATIGKQLVDAAEEHGFIYIRNLGQDISVEQVDEAFELSRRLFDAPIEEKVACAIQTNNRGWGGLHSETLDPRTQKIGDFKEVFNIGLFKKGQPQQPLPPAIVPDQARLEAFRDVCTAMCTKLLRLIGNGLGVGDFFAQAHEIKPGDECDTILRLLRYPPPSSPSSSPSPADAVRAGAHSDYGSITLLFRLRGQAGLEVQTTAENTWAPVPVQPPGTERDPAPPILVNVGDLLSYWTNGLLRSTVHRVVFGGSGVVEGESATDPRYSIAFFSSPSPSTELGVVPSERVRNFVPRGGDGGNPYAQRKVMRADEHLRMRLAETYGDLYKKNES
ncbi:Oxoglutarate/iron-dependent oxygenase [Cordyceps fumosorosea ARSEF 2679]|uniref:Oxoglutarate/iron-dependent oxygenase n=1 Tax=Cordyceps fumosorosea (strain ARSEF 2679) TaxID=1081104 RepID=A0A168D7U8_CORFA|nr:Oxoglutarate/iron-dependent oxygenase [Cordyceps fumosorosea ARSEF 2679]OAA72267.1 Oxoglutarate/iron-dependent oxygenase [Cordyceps fumosorosea ARSEF 2679]